MDTENTLSNLYGIYIFLFSLMFLLNWLTDCIKWDDETMKITDLVPGDESSM